MKVRFVEPPAPQRIGGLDGAIRSLEAALVAQGVEVLTEDAAGPCDIVHFHGIWQPSHASLSRELSAKRVPFLVSPHGMLEPWAWRHKWWKKWPYFFLRERGHLQRANCLLATAPAEERRLRQMIPGQRVETRPLGFTGEATPNHAAARARLGWEDGETVLLFLSRLHVKKGLDLLLQALANFAPPARIRLVIVGGGKPTYEKSLRELASQLSLPRVDWVGEVWGDARWVYLQGADLFCLPSHSENFGLAVLEACQVGTLALTTDTTPWGEWLGDGRGIIVRPDLYSVAAGLGRFFKMERRTAQDRQGLAEWARGEFSWQALAPRYVALYRELIDQAA